MKKIYVTSPSLPPFEEYCEAIKPIWQSKRLTNMGAYHKKFELALAEYLKVPMISLTVNGHMALELTIQSFDFKEGSEVITTPFTFISTTHAIIRNKLIPVFCDVKETDGTIDETKIEDMITTKTVAILPVHVYGHICNVKEINFIAKRHNLKVIYDAAHAFGIQSEGIGIGNFGDASIFSFHATKVFNSIEGGAVACKHIGLYDRLYNLKNFGIRDEETVVSVGINGKMNEFCAAMGLCNLKYIDRSIVARKKIHDMYISKLKSINGISVFAPNPRITSNYSYFPILVKENYKLSRDEVYDKLKKHGIYTRKYFYPLTCDMEFYNTAPYCPQLSTARRLANEVLVLPIYEGMSLSEINKIVSLLEQ